MAELEVFFIFLSLPFLLLALFFFLSLTCSFSVFLSFSYSLFLCLSPLQFFFLVSRSVEPKIDGTDQEFCLSEIPLIFFFPQNTQTHTHRHYLIPCFVHRAFGLISVLALLTSPVGTRCSL